MTTRQRAFADAYLKSGSAAEAARQAGYSERSARTTGARMLANADVKALIASRLDAAEARAIADSDEVLRFLSSVMRGEVRDQFGLDPALSDRIKAAQELLKRYAVADMRQQTTMQRLDSLILEFRAAINDGDAGR